MPLYDYRCATCNRVQESRQGQEVVSIFCPCGGTALRVSVYRVHIGGGLTTKFRLTEYQEAAAEANYYHDRMENDRGHEIPRLPVLKMAAQEAQKRGAKIAKLPEGI